MDIPSEINEGYLRRAHGRCKKIKYSPLCRYYRLYLSDAKNETPTLSLPGHFKDIWRKLYEDQKWQPLNQRLALAL